MGKLSVLTVWSVWQVEKQPQPPCSGPQGASLLIQLCPGLPAAPDESSHPASWCSAPPGRLRKSVPCPNRSEGWLPYTAPWEGLLSPASGSVPCLPHYHSFPTQPTIVPLSCGKPAFCGKLQGRVRRVSCSVLIGRPVLVGAWPR